ncbi:MAG: hypothetical protein Kow00124_11760 [Anaerolineae bacterium]
MDVFDDDSPVFKDYIEGAEFAHAWEDWQDEAPGIPVQDTRPGLWLDILREALPTILAAVDEGSPERDFAGMTFAYLSRLLYGEGPHQKIEKYDRLLMAMFFTGYMAALGNWTAPLQGDEGDWPDDDSEIPF